MDTAEEELNQLKELTKEEEVMKKMKEKK